MQYKVIAPKQIPAGLSIDLPASKSLSNRALIMNALAGGKGTLQHISDCDDTQVMLAAFDPDATKYVYAADGARIVDIGAAGTSMRFLTAYFATRAGAEIVMTGSERMKKRPIALLVEALRTLGAEIEYLETEGCPPLRIHGKQLEGGTLSIDGSVSSQYISALLMIAPTLTKGLQLSLTGRVTSVPYIEMTLSMMQEYGIVTQWDKETMKISVLPQQYAAREYFIESDWSASSYWYEIMALANDGMAQESEEVNIQLEGLFEKSLQGDAAIADFFAGIKAKPEVLQLDMTSQPDLAQTVIAACCALAQPFRITGLHTLRIKETDRVAALEVELKKLGYVVKDEILTLGNGASTIVMSWDGERCEEAPSPVIATYKDHRMAMAFAPLALKRESIDIDDPAVVSKSYPTYWDDLKKAGFIINVK